MSDTPRTDAETWRDEMDHVDTDYTFAQSATVSADFARQIERELAEAKFDLQFRRDLYTLQSKELAEAMEQRDTLAEALRKCVLWAECMSMRCERYRDNINWSYLNDAREALAAVKGGSHE